jgi:tryptophan synthase alpha chain
MNTTRKENRIDTRFSELKQRGEKALVGFVCAGDPDYDSSLKLIAAMCHGGLDILELGVPFSDPTADGPVIQRAAARALKNGASLGKAIAMTAALRQHTEIPIILFSYYNPVFAYGRDAFYRDARAAGADGVLVVDLPYEESGELTGVWKEDNQFALIRLVAPTTRTHRMRKIAEAATGFLYLVSKTGVTGSTGLDMAAVQSYVAAARSVADLPLCVGFGINEPDQARALSPHVDGVVVGSAFERTIEGGLDDPDLVMRLQEQARSFKAALSCPTPEV